MKKSFGEKGGGGFLRNHLMSRTNFFEISFYGYEQLLVSNLKKNEKTPEMALPYTIYLNISGKLSVI